MLTATGLSKTFGDTVAVRDVSFTVERGELFVIMGLSGSGKSTLVRMLNRLIEPTSGRVEVDGDDLAALDDAALRSVRNRKLAMVFQHFALLPHRSVRQNAAYGLRIRGEAEPRVRERVEWALHEVGLGDWGDALPAELSGGMRQRVGIARALATDAEILLLDEPFSALDPLIRREMQALLLRLQRDLQRTIVFITHDLNEATRLGDRILILRAGQVVQLGTGPEILEAPADAYVADFVADVDRTRVLTAADVMRPAGDHSGTAATVGPDAPLVALAARVGRHAEPLGVVDSEGRLLGLVSSADVLAGIASGARTHA
jgi:glycine betaine/proline transport system ATP-binding protein